MIRPICKEELFLHQKALPATREDIPIGHDLEETLRAHRDACVGMAANMIRENKSIIIVSLGFRDVVMFNPRIVARKGPYETEEGCLSLTGVRKTRRYQNITVVYRDFSWAEQRLELSGWPAEIVQHECDHLSGILI